MSFTQKILKAELSIAGGNFSGGGNAATLLGYAMEAVIDVSGGVSSGTMALAIYGLPLSVMNQLSTVGTQLMRRSQNKIKLYAGETGDGGKTIQGETLVFVGEISEAFVDAKAMPRVCFRVMAVPGGGYWAVAPAEPVSKSGPQDVAGMLGDLAKQMDLTLENNGVNVKLSNPYYGGAAWWQAVDMARDANIQMVVERGVMAISPAGKPRETDEVLISPQTGMKGYPAFRQAAIVVQSLFNPAVKCNGKIRVESDLTPACGVWMVFHIVYELACLVPNGPWFQTMEGTLASGGEAPA